MEMSAEERCLTNIRLLNAVKLLLIDRFQMTIELPNRNIFIIITSQSWLGIRFSRFSIK